MIVVITENNLVGFSFLYYCAVYDLYMDSK